MLMMESLFVDNIKTTEFIYVKKGLFYRVFTDLRLLYPLKLEAINLSFREFCGLKILHLYISDKQEVFLEV
jgi:hypothetical protein